MISLEKEGILMKVLMFGWEFPPYMSGGLGTACLGMTRALVDNSVEVLFVMPGQPTLLPDRFVRFFAPEPPTARQHAEPAPLDEETTVRRFLIDSPINPYLTVSDYRNRRQTLKTGILSDLGASGVASFVPYGSDLFSEVDRYARAAASIACRETFDVIHSHDWMTVPAAIRAREVSGKCWIFHVHSLEPDRSGEGINRGIFDMERYGLTAADHIIAVSNYTRRRIIEYYGIQPDKITVVHNGVIGHDMPELVAESGKAGKEKNVLFLGRITFQKGPDYFIEAAAEVLKRLPDVTFFMAGSGDMMTGMIEKVAEMGIGKHFHFTGFLRGEEVARIFRMSDLYVMPSVSEPFGISPLEATRYGVPVILSRQSGVAEILHHCLLVDFWDVRDMADKMMALLCRKPLVEELKARAREELFRAGWKEAASKIEAVYTQMIN
jgi:glycosyltransferase involved in cell wall biosynthesis